MAIGVVSPMILVSLSISTNGSGLMKKLTYRRWSAKFVSYVAVTVLCAAIPALLFLNPWWKNIEGLSYDSKAALIWSLNVLGFSSAMLVLVAISPKIIARLGLAEYTHLGDYTAFKQEVPEHHI
jgi:hypothetical protein